MARVLSRTRTAGLARYLGVQVQPQLGGSLGHRHSHTRRRAAEIIEVDLSSTAAEGTTASQRLENLEEAVDDAIARLSEPDWAPFRPGTSYFVPPRPAGVNQLLSLMSLSKGIDREALRGSVEQARAVAYSSRGYPCSTYFIDGHFPDEVNKSRLDADKAQGE